MDAYIFSLFPIVKPKGQGLKLELNRYKTKIIYFLKGLHFTDSPLLSFAILAILCTGHIKIQMCDHAQFPQWPRQQRTLI